VISSLQRAIQRVINDGDGNDNLDSSSKLVSRSCTNHDDLHTIIVRDANLWLEGNKEVCVCACKVNGDSKISMPHLWPA
jgi:hypothetical protein